MASISQMWLIWCRACFAKCVYQRLQNQNSKVACVRPCWTEESLQSQVLIRSFHWCHSLISFISNQNIQCWCMERSLHPPTSHMSTRCLSSPCACPISPSPLQPRQQKSRDRRFLRAAPMVPCPLHPLRPHPTGSQLLAVPSPNQ